MDIFSNTKFAFLTFRAHCSEPQAFEDFLTIILPLISLKSETYRWTIEKDNTPDKHIHIFFSHDKKDKSKIEQMIMTKIMKEFKSSLNETQWKYAFDLKLVENTQDDKMKCLGYVSKDINTRNETKNISQEIMTQSCDFYFAHRRIKNATSNDWIAINTKNIHNKIESFCKKESIDVNDPGLIPLMVSSKHTFCQISLQQRKMALTELKYQQGNKSVINTQILTEDIVETKGGHIIAEETELFNYIEYLEDKLKKENIEYTSYHFFTPKDKPPHLK